MPRFMVDYVVTEHRSAIIDAEDAGQARELAKNDYLFLENDEKVAEHVLVISVEEDK